MRHEAGGGQLRTPPGVLPTAPITFRTVRTTVQLAEDKVNGDAVRICILLTPLTLSCIQGQMLCMKFLQVLQHLLGDGDTPSPSLRLWSSEEEAATMPGWAEVRSLRGAAATVITSVPPFLG